MLAPSDWYQIKLFAQHATGLSMDAIHVFAGVLIQLLAALLLRSSLRRPLPLLIVLTVAVLNEANDFRVEQWPKPAMQFGEAAKDILATLILPLLLFAVARWRPRLFR